jgi:hypothetical protein
MSIFKILKEPLIDMGYTYKYTGSTGIAYKRTILIIIGSFTYVYLKDALIGKWEFNEEYPNSARIYDLIETLKKLERFNEYGI